MKSIQYYYISHSLDRTSKQVPSEALLNRFPVFEAYTKHAYDPVNPCAWWAWHCDTLKTCNEVVRIMREEYGLNINHPGYAREMPRIAMDPLTEEEFRCFKADQDEGGMEQLYWWACETGDGEPERLCMDAEDGWKSFRKNFGDHVPRKVRREIFNLVKDDYPDDSECEDIMRMIDPYIRARELFDISTEEWSDLLFCDNYAEYLEKREDMDHPDVAKIEATLITLRDKKPMTVAQVKAMFAATDAHTP